MYERTRQLAASCGLIAVLLLPSVADAHHEAIFGPQSSLMLTAPSYVSLQAYTRRLGSADHKTQESTMLLSGGITPFRSVPLSLTAILPASNISGTGGHHEPQRGLEDIVLGLRYRLELEGLQERFGAEGNLLLGIVAVEVPTGSIDHDAFDGPVNEMASVMGSLERGPFSGIAYGLYRRNGTHLGLEAGDQIFTGGGLAWTPFDDPATERLLSVQLGLSYELYRQDRQNGQTVAESGGHGVFAHPTIVWGPGGHTLLFAMVTVPLMQRFEDSHERNRWRAGAGIVHLF